VTGGGWTECECVKEGEFRLIKVVLVLVMVTNRHENIIAILDILRPRNIEDFKEVYLIQVSFLGGGGGRMFRSCAMFVSRFFVVLFILAERG
jgi:hypothetical protein